MRMERVYKLRKQRGLTQNDIARVLRVERSTYARYESGEINIPTEILILLSEFFGVTVDYLLNLEPEQNDVARRQTLEEAILNDPELTDESKADLIKQLMLVKLRDSAMTNNEFSADLAPKLS